MKIGFCLLSYRVLGAPRSLTIDCCLPVPPFSSVQADAANGDPQENKVEHEVRPPGQFPQDPATGAGYPPENVQQHQARVAAEAGHQRGGEPKATIPPIFRDEQDNSDDFKGGNCKDECMVEPGCKDLVEHLAAEFFRFEQFSKCRISEQQYKCPGHEISRRVSFHCHFLFKAKYLTQRLTVAKGCARGMRSFRQKILTND